MKKLSRDYYIHRLTLKSEFVLLFLKFTSNFNESLLTAEITQTFFKFFGINIWSSTVIWAVPPIIFIFLAPAYKAIFLNNKFNTFLLNMGSVTVMFFLNSLGFITLFALESIAAKQAIAPPLMLLMGYISFFVVDFAKMIYELMLFDYMASYVEIMRKRKFIFVGIAFEISGRVLGAFISGLYIVLGKNNFARFSEQFYTNMQFCYYFAIALNALAVLAIFMFWPKHFNVHKKENFIKPGGMLENFFPGLSRFKTLEPRNKLLLSRLFFVVGLYWLVAVSLTQWISNKFMSDYPEILSNSSMQAIDIGTAWGSIGLTIFYGLWGLNRMIIYPRKKQLMPYSRRISRWINLFGFALFALCYYVYATDVRYIIIILGISGLCYDWLLCEKIRKRLIGDDSLENLPKSEKKYLTNRIVEEVSFLAELTFFVILPIIFVKLPDRNWMLLISGIYFLMACTVPTDISFNV